MTNLKPTVQRVRHAIKPRVLLVQKIAHVTPLLVKVTFSCDDLGDFYSASFDDHIKLFFPTDGVLVRPEAGPDGLVFPAGITKPPARDYTPRRFDQSNKELDVEFVLHGDGPAANWVTQARVGDRLLTAGPRGSFIIPTDLDWLLLVGDETALPAIARRLEEAPEAARIFVVAEVQNAQEEQVFKSRADISISWIHRKPDQPDALEKAVRGLNLPDGDGYVWGAGEASQMRAIHQHLVTQRGIDKSCIRASSYWKRGAAAVHETHGGA